MQDLKDVTRETHYENYRTQCIQSMTRMVVKERNRKYGAWSGVPACGGVWRDFSSLWDDLGPLQVVILGDWGCVWVHAGHRGGLDVEELVMWGMPQGGGGFFPCHWAGTGCGGGCSSSKGDPASPQSWIWGMLQQ